MKKKIRTPRKKKNIFVIFFRNIFKLIDKSIITPITKFFVVIKEKLDKKTGNLEKWLVKKNTMIIMSLIIACLFFFYVDSRSNVLIDSSAEVLRNQKVEANYNKEAYVVEGLPEEADVTLIGRRVDLYLAKQLATGNVTVDISNLKPGTHKVDLNYESSINSVDYKLDPSTVTVIIYPKMSSTMVADIDILNKDKLNDKFAIKSVDIDQKEIIIKGAEHTLNEVASVKALVDVNNIVDPKEGVTKLEEVNLVAYNSKGEVVEVEMVPNKVTATISIVSPSITVPIKIIPKGEVQIGRAISSINSSISQITVYGDEEVVSKLKFIPVEIDVTGLSETKKYNIVIDKPIGIRNISDTTMEVTVGLGKETERIIKNIKINTENLDSSYSVQSIGKESSMTDVIVKGTEDVLKHIDPTTISASVDLSGFSEGEHTVSVTVSGDDLKARYISKTTQIKVKIFKKDK